MKKSKWLSLTALTAAAMMVAGLVAGCGGGGSPAANSNEIKVGGNFELTGGIATLASQQPMVLNWHLKKLTQPAVYWVSRLCLSPLITNLSLLNQQMPQQN